MADYDRKWIRLEEVEVQARSIVKRIPRSFQWVYGIPRGGIPAAMAIKHAWSEFHGQNLGITSVHPDLLNARGSTCTRENTLIVDDIYDSGKTLAPFLEAEFTCISLVSKGKEVHEGFVGVLHVGQYVEPSTWVVFPWESDDEQTGPADAVRRLLQFIGEDPDAPHLQETPRRFLSWLEEFRKDQEPDFRETKFEVRYDGIVLVRNIPFTSLCAHHLLPFSGHATVAYIPIDLSEKQNVLGLSKLARIVNHQAKRLQSQEELTTQIRDAITGATLSQDVAVTIRAEHSCMTFRGPRVPGAETVTSSLSGKFFTDSSARAEFFSLAQPSA